MTKIEFLNGLSEALMLKMDEHNIREQVRYYSDYIDGEVGRGRTESEVVAELGDPWTLAKNLEGNITDEVEYIHQETMNENGDIESGRTERSGGNGKSFTWHTNSTLGCWIFVIIFLAIVFGILYLLVGAISALAPFIIPVVVVMIIVRFIQKRMR